MKEKVDFVLNIFIIFVIFLLFYQIMPSYDMYVYQSFDGFHILQGIFSGVFGIIWLAFLVFMIVVQRRVFEKGGLPGWGIFIPIYNIYLMFKLAGKPGRTWWLLFPPVLGIGAIIAQFKIAKNFGKDTGYGVGLWLLPVIFYPILAFGDATYKGKFEE